MNRSLKTDVPKFCSPKIYGWGFLAPFCHQSILPANFWEAKRRSVPSALSSASTKDDAFYFIIFKKIILTDCVRGKQQNKPLIFKKASFDLI